MNDSRVEISVGRRFAFGANWQTFVKLVNGAIIDSQERTPPNVGSALRNEILVISFSDAVTGTTPTDPPEVGTDFNVGVFDVATDTLLAGVLHTANGTESIADVITALTASLLLIPI